MTTKFEKTENGTILPKSISVSQKPEGIDRLVGPRKIWARVAYALTSLRKGEAVKIDITGANQQRVASIKSCINKEWKKLNQSLKQKVVFAKQNDLLWAWTIEK